MWAAPTEAMIRAFVAVNVPEPLVGTLSTAQVGLDVGNPVAPENFHITLAFLGEHQETVIADVADTLSMIAETAFDIEVSGLGTFGSPARLLFADVVPSPPLSALHRRVRRAASEGGVELPHQRYHPHVTLARLGQGVIGPEVDRLQAHIARRMGMIRGEFRATGFTLFESRLGRSGPVYTPLVDFPLRLS